MENWPATIHLFARARADGNVVDGAGAVFVQSVRLSLTLVATRLFIDLHLESRVHRHVGRVVVHPARPVRIAAIGHLSRGVQQTKKDPGVVVHAVELELQPEGEIAIDRFGVVKQSHVVSRLRHQRAVHAGKRAAAHRPPQVEHLVRAIEQIFEARLLRRFRRLRDQSIGQSAGQRKTGPHRVGGTNRREQRRAGNVGIFH